MFLKLNVVLTTLQFLFPAVSNNSTGACQLERQETQILVSEGHEIPYGSVILV